MTYELLGKIAMVTWGVVMLLGLMTFVVLYWKYLRSLSNKSELLASYPKCPDCLGYGRQRLNGGWDMCFECNGTGRIKPRGEK